ncbi:crotonobetainyl-CoA:carnitine CoA-transferase CaiB-like acyl-CoA transferase [Thermocatellispora tengchongensis]|uniref:Crotonobetainyl-CoA:carnitine CoA-transferase CaiB-like acyl-CoA transferase n=1 Tax=Thermocatellispora tengchongensis TaxID=1073253 RepID=A0A840PKT1_9ACTN|nr:CoA transferase [Thermocatellispora tengchongensis]MBB5136665.1 crotonobetainyl-CoA:carnitine CoA-transferase CaiB-like acyl-CoA transferase [Thermocatellispora tengchongensis]
MHAARGLPLAGLRVIDLADGKAEMCGRFLADLGADVIRVEPPGGAPTRRREPLHEGVSLYFATHNANKRGITLDLRDSADRGRLLDLAAGADILIETERPGALDRLGIGADALLARNPALVVVSITDFGQTGPYRDWIGTDWTHLALGGVLSRSGIPGREPVLPPGPPAYESAAVQAAFAGLLAYLNRLDTGRGDHVDCSVYEMTAQTLDPGFGIGGSATGGVPATELPRGRPDAGRLYPIFRCADGYVRICLLARRQWRGMFAWLGEPEEFADPKYDTLAGRFGASERLHVLIGELFRDRTRDELVARGQERGVPIAALLDPGEVLAGPHFLARGSLVDAEVAPGLTGRLPSGYVEVNGVRAGFRHRAPEVGEHNDEVFAEAARTPPAGPAPAAPAPRRPLEGLRVLDLGVIVAGAELGRLLADQGAEVIKVESRAYPDGSRQSLTGQVITASFARGHRNKLSAGINLRSPEGLDIFKRLAARSDVILSNFKPGTLESLGLGYDVIGELNPRIIMADSSALGASGPWSRRMGYGPLVRASTGLTGLWRDTGVEGGFCDAITIYPDHIAARVAAVAVLAALIERRRTGRGGTVSVAQAETILTQMSTGLLRESLRPGTLTPHGNTGEWDAPQGLYPCAGEDEWCVVSVEGEERWRSLCRVIGRDDLLADPRLATSAGRRAHRGLIDAAVTAWTAATPPRECMRRLQEAGVPAGMMQRVTEYLDDPQLRARGFLREMRQPHIGHTLPTENGPAAFRGIADPELRPAPLMGEHTRLVAAKLLGLAEPEVDRLIEAGVLEETDTKAEV